MRVTYQAFHFSFRENFLFSDFVFCENSLSEFVLIVKISMPWYLVIFKPKIALNQKFSIFCLFCCCWLVFFGDCRFFFVINYLVFICILTFNSWYHLSRKIYFDITRIWVLEQIMICLKCLTRDPWAALHTHEAVPNNTLIFEKLWFSHQR